MKRTKQTEVKVKRKDLFMVPPHQIVIEEGFNARKDLGRKDGSFQALKDSIASIGIQVPLMVSKKSGKKNDPSSVFSLIAGERRLTAVRELIQDGIKITRIPCIPVGKEYSETDKILLMVTENNQKPLLPDEEGEAYKRLVRYGMTEAEIAKKVGKSVTHVKNRIAMINNPVIVEAYKNGDISVSEASSIAKIDGKEGQDEAVEEISELRKEVKKKGKKRVPAAKKKEIVDSKKKKVIPIEVVPEPETTKFKKSQFSIERKDALILRDNLIERFEDLDPSFKEELAFLRGQITLLDYLLGDDEKLRTYSLHCPILTSEVVNSKPGDFVFMDA